MITQIHKEFDHETGKLISRFGECPCGAIVDLMDPMDNLCNKCGRWYNGSGSELLPPELWEENIEEEEAARPINYFPLFPSNQDRREPVSSLPAKLTGQFIDILLALSPENLTCDGELSPRTVATKEKMLRNKWASLEVEAGRKVTENEIMDSLMNKMNNGGTK